MDQDLTVSHSFGLDITRTGFGGSMDISTNFDITRATRHITRDISINVYSSCAVLCFSSISMNMNVAYPRMYVAHIATTEDDDWFMILRPFEKLIPPPNPRKNGSNQAIFFLGFSREIFYFS